MGSTHMIYFLEYRSKQSNPRKTVRRTLRKIFWVKPKTARRRGLTERAGQRANHFLPCGVSCSGLRGASHEAQEWPKTAGFQNRKACPSSRARSSVPSAGPQSRPASRPLRRCARANLSHGGPRHQRPGLRSCPGGGVLSPQSQTRTQSKPQPQSQNKPVKVPPELSRRLSRPRRSSSGQLPVRRGQATHA